MSWGRNDDDDRREEERRQEERREDDRREEQRQEMQRQLDNSRDEVYVAADGSVHSTPQGAVAASLIFESASNTGAGCSQDPDNIKP